MRCTTRGGGGGGGGSKLGRSESFPNLNSVFWRISSTCRRNSRFERFSSRFSSRSRWISRCLIDFRGKLNDGFAILMKKLAINNPAANVRKNGTTLFNTPRNNILIHLVIVYVNVYAAFSKSVSKIQPNSKIHFISFRADRKVFSASIAKNIAKIWFAGEEGHYVG